ncbi:hypothetical protein [Clostridium sp. AM58-1XD]|uniref:putative ABC transporter permease n=1 Tax=Clostridium sp. AM58-1XD TaxID=2292307 RepID=UPI000E494F1A|nr:hypothetical protein [Clostridium sp. AM58-1XD]RGY99282.1 hypothetical protein DXA13_08670 [Clostridium sp. AM58-1XD]
MYTYTWYEWMAFFYIYCFFGWIFESVYVSVREHRLVNRGFLRLPMLPLYGTGAVMMLWVSLPVKGSIILVYISGVIAATLLEYVTGYVMERLFKIKYWDYSNQKFQFQGYICLSSSIAWGFLTIFLTEVIHRPISAFVTSVRPVWLLSGTAVISIFFVCDVVQSTREALALGKVLETMTKLRADLDDMQVQLALLKAEAEQRIDEFLEDKELKLAELRARKEQVLSESLKSLMEKRETITHHIGFYRKGLLLGNPTAVSRRFNDALKELRELARSHTVD